MEKSADTKGRKVPLTELDRRRSEKIREIIKEKGFSQQDIAGYLGLDQSYFSKLLAGKNLWKTYYLEKLAIKFDLPLADLLIPDHHIAIAAIISAKGFPYRDIEAPSGGLGVAPIPLDIKEMEGLYCLKVGENGLSYPYINQDSILYVEAGSGHKVKEGNPVIWVDDSGIGHLKIVKFSGDFIILTSPYPGIPDVVKPRNQLRALDRVHSIKI